MKVSLNWVKEFTSVGIPADKLVEKIGAQLGAVEEVVDVGAKYKGILIAKVITSEPHPNADKLHVCMIDTGKPKHVQVVCGAPNVAAGQMVVWIPPGATVPSTYGKEPFVLEAKELRGVVSNGMIASAKELALGDDHSGILVLGNDVKPGQDFAKSFGLDDRIIDIENKMFTHRPDLFGMIGIAREIAGIQHQAFKSPDWYKEDASLVNDGRKNVLPLAIKNDVPKLVPRFCAIAIKDVKVQDSPVWLKAQLASLGVRPINNIVDLTNYYMLLTAQPLHAYDYDKVSSGVLGVRLSKAGESLKLLGGKDLKLRLGAVVITDGSKPIGLGGVMGGADTEVGANTKNIILEVANFDMNATRRTAMEYGLFTDAATRFTKNQSPRQNRAVLAKAVGDILAVAGGRVASKIIDDNHAKTAPKPVQVSTEFINLRLGEELTTAQIKRLLENVEFEVKVSGTELSVQAPFWRTDIEIPEDLVEEVGRLYGYEHLPLALPERDLTAAPADPLLAFKARTRDILSRAGANETLTYSFVHGSLLEAAGQQTGQAYHIKNALSPDLQYYRPSLVPSLLEKVHPNIKAGYDNFALFEMGKVHVKGMLDPQKLPMELDNLALVVAAKNPEHGAAYFAAKQYAEFLMNEAGIWGATYSMQPALPQAYDPKRSAWIYMGKNMVGVVGEPSSQLRARLKLPAYTAQFELNLNALLGLASPRPYHPLNRFPELGQDICLRAAADLPYADLANLVDAKLGEVSAVHGYEHQLTALDIFQRPSDKTHKQTTWRITLSHPERTLTTAETNKVLDEVAAAAKTKFKAERI